MSSKFAVVILSDPATGTDGREHPRFGVVRTPDPDVLTL